MNIQGENRPIFIVGSYRSGTSVLTWCLGQHPNILPIPETYWIAKLTIAMDDLFTVGSKNGHYTHLGALGWNKQDFYAAFGRAVDQFVVGTREPYLRFARRKGARRLGLNDQQIDEWEKNRSSKTYAINTKNYQIVRNPSDPKHRWVDGTPDNSNHMYGLSILFPEAQFIHILRDPNEVALSLMNFSKAGGAGKDYREAKAYATWQRLTEFALKGEKALGRGKVLRIYYDELVKDAESTLRGCLDFLHEEFSYDCLLPLREKINSSKVELVKTRFPNPKSLNGTIANKFYQSIKKFNPPTIPDIKAKNELAECYKTDIQISNPVLTKSVCWLMNKCRKLFKGFS